MTPNDELMAQWLDDELSGAEAQRIDAWAAGQPDVLARRAELRAWKARMQASLAAEVEPPYAEFFNQRILRTIERELAADAPAAQPSGAPARLAWWRWLAVPGMAAAMALCFWGGTRVSQPVQVTVVASPKVDAMPLLVYTPYQGVTAEVLKTPEDDDTVIVLQGLDELPASIEMPDNAALPSQSSLQLIANPDQASF